MNNEMIEQMKEEDLRNFAKDILKGYQKEVLKNKIDKGFNTENVEMEFLSLIGEVSESYTAYLEKSDDIGEELADIMIYLLGIAEILGIDMDKELRNKVEKNKNRKYYYDGTKLKKEEG